MARPFTALRYLADLLDIDQLASDLSTPPGLTAATYYGVTDLVDFDWLEGALVDSASDDTWERRAAEGLRADLRTAHRQLTRSVLLCGQRGEHVDDCLATYLAEQAGPLDFLRALINDVRTARQPSLAALTVVLHELGRLTQA